MSNKTPEQRAEEVVEIEKGVTPGSFAKYAEEDNVNALMFRMMKRAAKRSRSAFIRDELPKLLELARRGMYFVGEYGDFNQSLTEDDFTHSIPELLAMAEKGEV